MHLGKERGRKLGDCVLFFVTPRNRKPPRDEERDGNFEKKARLNAWGLWKTGKVHQGSEEERMCGLNGQETYGLERKKNL